MSTGTKIERADSALEQIRDALQAYAAAHPKAKIDIYRHSSVSIRVRIVDFDFDGKSRSKREEEVWGLLDRLPDEVVAELSLLLLLTPKEAKASFANVEFENPVQPGL